MSGTIGRLLSAIGIVCALVGILYLEGIALEFPGIILGGEGHYLGLQNRDRAGQILGIIAVVLCVISLGISAIDTPPQ